MGDYSMYIVAALAFVSVASLGWVFSGNNSRVDAKRLRNMASSKKVKRGKRSISALDQSASRRKQIQETLKDMDAHQKEKLAFARPDFHSRPSLSISLRWLLALALPLFFFWPARNR